MSVVRNGSTRSYSDNWEQAFGSKKKVARKQVATAKTTKKATKKVKRAKK